MSLTLNNDFYNFKLRPICVDDAEPFFDLVNSNRSRLINYLPITVKGCADVASTSIFINDKIAEAEKKEFYCFVIEDINTHELLGALVLKKFDWSVPKCEIGYFIDKHYEGKGIISKALSAIIKFCFESLKMNKLFIRTATDNFSSKKVAEKNGFIVEGILRNDFRTENDALVDMIYYGLLRETA